MLSDLFAPMGKYEPCGLFTAGYAVVVIASFAAVALLMFFSRKMQDKDIKRTITACMIIIWSLEIIKIIFNITVNGVSSPNNYIPLYFCSLALYSTPLSCFGRGRIKRCGDVFIAVGCTVGGVCALIYPNTSLTFYPAIHFISFQSAVYHIVMLYMGLLVLTRRYVVLSVNDLIPYGIFVLAAGVVAHAVNLMIGSNLMFVTRNYPGTPIEWVYDLTGPAFPVAMIAIHIFAPFFAVFVLSKAAERLISGRHKKADT